MSAVTSGESGPHRSREGGNNSSYVYYPSPRHMEVDRAFPGFSRFGGSRFRSRRYGVALWFHGGGATPGFADFVRPILDAKTVKYKVTCEVTSPLTGTTVLSAETQKDSASVALAR